MSIEDIKDFITEEVKKLNTSLKENSWDNCDDDERPNFDQIAHDHAQIGAYEKVLTFIKKYNPES